jgi:RNA polymerase sigma-70 factor (ECF subfamily)
MEKSMDDLQAIRRIKQGDIGGLEHLVARYQVRAVRTAFLITHDDQLAQDIVQETFVRFYHHARHFNEARAFEPYFNQSIVYAALNIIKRESRQTPFNTIDTDVLENLLEQAATVEDQVVYGQFTEEILLALKQLSPRQRAVIIQRYYLEMNEQEMAHDLNVAPGTIKWFLNAARTKLRGLLDRKGVF